MDTERLVAVGSVVIAALCFAWGCCQRAKSRAAASASSLDPEAEAADPPCPKKMNHDATLSVREDLASDVAKALAGLGMVGLRALAENMSIETYGKSEAELVTEIMFLITEKN